MSSLAERVQVGTPVIWYDDEEWPYYGVVETIFFCTGEIRCRFEFDIEDMCEPGATFTKLFDNHDLGRVLELSDE